MAYAKKELGDIVCLTGNFPGRIISYGTKLEVIEGIKRNLDICMPGGGYIFDLDGGLYNASTENVQAMYETIREYGRY